MDDEHNDGVAMREGIGAEQDAEKSRNETKDQGVQHSMILTERGPADWFGQIRAQMMDSNSHKRIEALLAVPDRVFSDADGGRGSHGEVVHKSILRSICGKLTDEVLHVREAAKETLALLCASFPVRRSLCVKYAGHHLSVGLPVRVRLFLLGTIKDIVQDALALVHHISGHGAGISERGIEKGLWFQGAQLAAIDALQIYAESEQVCSQNTIYLHEEHGALIEVCNLQDASPLEVQICVSSACVLWVVRPSATSV